MEAPTPSSEDKPISETITIDQDNIRYILHLNSIGNTITFSLEYNSNNYSKKMPLKDIKDKESRAIFISYSSQDFIQFLKKLSEMKKISVIRKDNSVIIKFEFEAMFMKHEIEIELRSKDNNLELLEKEVKELKEENILLKKRIDDLETEVKEIKKMLNPNFNINRIKIGNKSVIMKENEFDLIHLAIKSRLNKEVKELKKLYQATIDGDGAINFHSRCDNIPNTLVLIKSAGNRRFGGFTSVQWTSSTSGEYKDDPNAFLFSLDKQKIYSYKNDKNAIYCYKDYGPTFGSSCDIHIYQHGIQEKHLYTNESSSSCSYNYNGDNNALSEDGKGSYINATDYEVFQVIFS